MKKIYPKEFERAWFIQALFLLAVGVFILTGCASVSSRIETLDQILEQSNFESDVIQTAEFNIFAAYHPGLSQYQGAQPLRVYIEGDGYAWITRFRVSDNPTPRQPIGLRLASASEQPAFYLARPCQYVEQEGCTPNFWTSGRFHPKTISSLNQALDQIKHRFQSQELHLIGFSGGAYMALALAARRDDVTKVTTVAGVLDPVAWTQHHSVSALYVPLSASDLIAKSTQTSVLHLCGGNDKKVPCSLTQKFVDIARQQGLQNHGYKEIQSASHDSWMSYAAGLPMP